jgi:hypothetical protein
MLGSPCVVGCVQHASRSTKSKHVAAADIDESTDEKQYVEVPNCLNPR